MLMKLSDLGSEVLENLVLKIAQARGSYILD